jgi:hypothetical protein
MALALPAQWQPYWQLARLDKPIGTLLLLWPTLWALWLAADGLPPLSLLFIFIAGVFVMRSAGCVINDYADRNFDGYVKRTASRPLPAGRLSTTQALLFFFLLVMIAFLLVWQLNQFTISLSVGGLLLAAIYPFMKRITSLPQLVLGMAFSWSIPMAYGAVAGHLSLTTWLLFLANLMWTIAYDTMYAMVDRDDDLEKLLPKFDEELIIYAYEKIWSELSELDRKIVYVISTGVYKTGEIREKLSISPQLLNTYRKRLMERGVVNGSVRGELTLALPRFEEYIEMYCEVEI